ncbi:MAG: hypothetical protein AB7E61_03495 [Acholeplasmataceae bacterium]
MKKIILITLLCLVVSISVGETFALENQAPNDFRNYINLSRFKKTRFTIDGYCDDIYDITPNDTYTLVMSYEYLGDHLSEVRSKELEIEVVPDAVPFVYAYLDDQVNQRIYVEFQPQDDFTVFSMPFDIDNVNPNYEVILYHGSYEEFPGFEPFLDTSFNRIDYAEITMSYDQQLTEEQLLDLIHAYDSNHQVLNYSITSDNYFGSDKMPGTYELMLMSELNHIKKYLMLSIIIIDKEAPIIIGPDVINVTFGDEPSLMELFDQFTITDNVDILDQSDILIEQENYSTANSIGSYTVYFSVTDHAGNTAYDSFVVNINDDTAPTIFGPDQIFLYTDDQPLSTLEILDLFSANDDVDQNVEITILSDQYLQTTIAGVYEVLLQASDAHENIGTYQSFIHVIDNQAPIFEYDEPILNLITTEVMNETDMIVYFKNYMSSQNHNIENVSILYNEYLDHENNEGSYYVYFSYQLNGIDYTSRILVDVSKQNTWLDYWYYGLGMIPLIGITIFIVVRKKK